MFHKAVLLAHLSSSCILMKGLTEQTEKLWRVKPSVVIGTFSVSGNWKSVDNKSQKQPQRSLPRRAQSKKQLRCLSEPSEAQSLCKCKIVLSQIWTQDIISYGYVTVVISVFFVGILNQNTFRVLFLYHFVFLLLSCTSLNFLF